MSNTTRENFKLLNTIGQHYHRPQATSAEAAGGNVAGDVATPSPPTAAGGDSGVGGGVSVALSDAAGGNNLYTAAITGAAIACVAAVAGVTAARSLQFKLQYEREHTQSFDFNKASQSSSSSSLKGATEEAENGKKIPTSAFCGLPPLHCINMPSAHIAELKALFQGIGGGANDSVVGRGGEREGNNVSLEPTRTLLTLFESAGGLYAAAASSSASGGNSNGGGGGANVSGTNGLIESEGGIGSGGDDDSGGRGGGRLASVARGAPVSNSRRGGGGKYVRDCKQRVIEAYRRLALREKKNRVGDAEQGEKKSSEDKKEEATRPLQIPCIAEQFLVFVNNNEPDIFYTIADVARRFAGQRITLVHCISLTVDGTHTRDFSSAVSGTVTADWLDLETAAIRGAIAKASSSSSGGEKDNSNKNNKHKKEKDSDSDSDDEDFGQLLRRIPFEVLFQPTADAFAPTTRHLSNKHLSRLLSTSRKPTTVAAGDDDEAEALHVAASLPAFVHTSNALDFAFYNNEQRLAAVDVALMNKKEEHEDKGNSSSTATTCKKGTTAGGKDSSDSSYGSLARRIASKAVAVLFPQAHSKERRAIVEELFRGNVPITARRAGGGKNDLLITATNNASSSSASVLSGGTPLFSPRLTNYVRLAFFLRYGRQADPEHYPLLAAVAKCSRVLLGPLGLGRFGFGADAGDELKEEAVEPSALFSLSSASPSSTVSGTNGAGAQPSPSRKKKGSANANSSSTTADHHLVGGMASSSSSSHAPLSLAAASPSTPLSRSMLTPRDMRRLRQWIDKEWAYCSAAWAALRGNTAPMPLVVSVPAASPIAAVAGATATTARPSVLLLSPATLNIRDTCGLSDTIAAAAPLVAAIYNSIVAAQSSRYDAHLHAAFMNDILVEVDAGVEGTEDEDEEIGSFPRHLAEHFPSLYAQSLLVLVSNDTASSSSSDESTNSNEKKKNQQYRIVYNTIGHVADAMAAIVEQCRLLQMDGCGMAKSGDTSANCRPPRLRVLRCSLGVALHQYQDASSEGSIGLDFTAAEINTKSTTYYSTRQQRSANLLAPFLISPMGRQFVNPQTMRPLTLAAVAAAVVTAEIRATNATVNESGGRKRGGGAAHASGFSARRVRREALAKANSLLRCGGGSPNGCSTLGLYSSMGTSSSYTATFAAAGLAGAPYSDSAMAALLTALEGDEPSPAGGIFGGAGNSANNNVGFTSIGSGNENGSGNNTNGNFMNITQSASNLATPFVAAALATTATAASGNDLELAQKAATYVSRHHPALTVRRGLVPMGDNDAKDRNLCAAGSCFVLEELQHAFPNSAAVAADASATAEEVATVAADAATPSSSDAFARQLLRSRERCTVPNHMGYASAKALGIQKLKEAGEGRVRAPGIIVELASYRIFSTSFAQ